MNMYTPDFFKSKDPENENVCVVYGGSVSEVKFGNVGQKIGFNSFRANPNNFQFAHGVPHKYSKPTISLLGNPKRAPKLEVTQTTFFEILISESKPSRKHRSKKLKEREEFFGLVCSLYMMMK